ncbi:hypothetical protein Tco_0064000 [Tanacetum coccineum]
MAAEVPQTLEYKGGQLNVAPMLEESNGTLKVMKERLTQKSHPLAGDGVAGIKRRRRNLSSDDVRNMATVSGRGRLKEDLESSTWRRRSLDLDGENKERTRLRLFYDLRKYCLELLRQFGLLAAKPVATPLPENCVLSSQESKTDLSVAAGLQILVDIVRD